MRMPDFPTLRARWPAFVVTEHFPAGAHAGEVWVRVVKDDVGAEEVIFAFDEALLRRLDAEHQDRALQLHLNQSYPHLYVGRPAGDRRVPIWLRRDGRPAEHSGLVVDVDVPEAELHAFLAELNERAADAVLDSEDCFWCSGCHRSLPRPFLHGHVGDEGYCGPCVNGDAWLQERVVGRRPEGVQLTTTENE